MSLATACALSGATQHELQSNGQMAATCAGLKDAQEGHDVIQRWAAASECGATQQELLGTAFLIDFRNIQSMRQETAVVWKSHWKWPHRLGGAGSQGITCVGQTYELGWWTLK